MNTLCCITQWKVVKFNRLIKFAMKELGKKLIRDVELGFLINFHRRGKNSLKSFFFTPKKPQHWKVENVKEWQKYFFTWSKTFSGELSSWYELLDARLISILGVNGAIRLVVTLAAPVVVDSCDSWLIWIDDGLFLCGKTPAGLPLDSMPYYFCDFAHVFSLKFSCFLFSSSYCSRNFLFIFFCIYTYITNTNDCYNIVW